MELPLHRSQHARSHPVEFGILTFLDAQLPCRALKNQFPIILLSGLQFLPAQIPCQL
jgi:hypothetical protein